MEATAAKPKRAGAKRKYNWEIILADVEAGIPLREVSQKYAVPMTTLDGKVRDWRRENALIARLAPKDGLLDVGRPAVFSSQMVVESSKSVENQIVPAELTDAEVVTLLSNPETLVSLPPAEAEKLMARRLQILAGQALATLPPAASVKDALALVKAFRDTSGLASKDGKGGSGLLGAPRSLGRRAVAMVEAEVVHAEPATEIPAGFEWPEGM